MFSLHGGNSYHWREQTNSLQYSHIFMDEILLITRGNKTLSSKMPSAVHNNSHIQVFLYEPHELFVTTRKDVLYVKLSKGVKSSIPEILYIVSLMMLDRFV